MKIPNAQSKTTSTTTSSTRTGSIRTKPPEASTDPLALVSASRQRDQAGMLKMRQQLDKMIYEMQQKILASRAKFNAARWKLINKSMD